MVARDGFFDSKAGEGYYVCLDYCLFARKDQASIVRR